MRPGLQVATNAGTAFRLKCRSIEKGHAVERMFFLLHVPKLLGTLVMLLERKYVLFAFSLLLPCDALRVHGDHERDEHDGMLCCDRLFRDARLPSHGVLQLYDDVLRLSGDVLLLDASPYVDSLYYTIQTLFKLFVYLYWRHKSLPSVIRRIQQIMIQLPLQDRYIEAAGVSCADA